MEFRATGQDFQELESVCRCLSQSSGQMFNPPYVENNKDRINNNSNNSIHLDQLLQTSGTVGSALCLFTRSIMSHALK
jgi:hypothetical protein